MEEIIANIAKVIGIMAFLFIIGNTLHEFFKKPAWKIYEEETLDELESKTANKKLRIQPLTKEQTDRLLNIARLSKLKDC
ncbi:MAG: hypothetical protein ABIG60_03350 [Patescibacteria group bacterium]